jgi:1,4-alpha-glucan branching enzyme
VVLMGRGIPMFFMGGESGEHRQFLNGSSGRLDLNAYLADSGREHIRASFNSLIDLRAHNNVKGPSPLAVVCAQDQRLGFVRGQGNEYYTLANFGGWFGWKSLAELNLPEGVYHELWNSTCRRSRSKTKTNTPTAAALHACTAGPGCTSRITAW